MKIAIFGATGKTGIEVVKQALENGFEVTAFVRDPLRLSIENKDLTVIKGDVSDSAGVSETIKNQDVVVCVLGTGNDLKKTTIRTTGTINLISGMKKNNVKRLIVMTAMGIGESWSDLSLFNRFFFATLLKNSRNDHEKQEAAVKESNLEWTIIRPSGLTETPRTGGYNVGEHISGKTSKIPRADVADLIIRELKQKKLIGKAVTITN